MKTEKFSGYVVSVVDEGLWVSIGGNEVPMHDAFMPWYLVPKNVRPLLTERMIFFWELCLETGETVELTLPPPRTKEEIEKSNEAARKRGRELYEELGWGDEEQN